MPPCLHATDTTSSPWLSRIALKTRARSTKEMHIAMPTLRNPIRVAKWQISSTRDHLQ